MSGIDELKQNAVEPVRIEIGAEPSRHRMITPNYNNNSYHNSDDRLTVDLTQEFPEEKSPEIHESITKDILEGPDSPFEKYKEEKKKEMIERMATFDAEQELAKEEAEEAEISAEDDEEEIFGTDSIGNHNTAVAYKEENIDYNETVNEIVEDTHDSSFVEETIPVEEVKKNEEIETPEIDLDVTNVTNEGSSVIENVIEEDESANQVDEDDVLEHLQKLATERLKPISKSLNISSFTVLKKPTANIKSLSVEQVKAAKWVLPTQESVVMMKEFLGSELESLREFSEDSASPSQLFKKYKTIYDHIVSPKPATYEQWLKTTPYSDIDHYFFAVYIASFKGANYLPLDCANPKCHKTFLTEDFPIMDMVKFNTKEDKDKFVNLYESESTPAGKGIYCSEIVPLSNKLAIAFKDASVYSLLEIASLNMADRDKFSNILELIPYIDALYIINQEKMELEPIGYKIFPDNASKTTKSKIKTFNEALKSLSVDEFTIIKSYIRSITTRNNGISYKYPSTDCPYCGKATSEIPVSAEEAVFTRYQLSALANTSLK